MMALDGFALELIDRFPLGFVATVTPEGRPSVSPKGTFLVLDPETIAFGEIRSPATIANLAANPAVEVNFIDIWKRKGLRVTGEAALLARGTPAFDALWPRWQAQWGGLADRIRSLVRIEITHTALLTTPPYDDGVSEEEMIALYSAKFRSYYP